MFRLTRARNDVIVMEIGLLLPSGGSLGMTMLRLIRFLPLCGCARRGLCRRCRCGGLALPCWTRGQTVLIAAPNCVPVYIAPPLRAAGCWCVGVFHTVVLTDPGGRLGRIVARGRKLAFVTVDLLLLGLCLARCLIYIN